uniref:DnaJ like subfamily C member 3 n=1 Tax=Ganoderma boninense TaxID=34458 RepID=A0A5K1JTU0_9APHY|nr:DnaJ like subfamily C member 3 [Ganoderma boninense]
MAKEIPSTLSLPTELWIQILESSPRDTLAHVALVNHSLSEVAERILYRTVVLKWNTPEARIFFESIATCPRRGTLVLDISILRIDGTDTRLPAILPTLLMALPNLHAVTLRSSVPIPVCFESIGILDIRLTHLRSFAANLKVDPSPSSTAAFFAFLAAHPSLDTLDVRGNTLTDLPAHCVQDRRHLAALRVLACSSRFLNSRAPVLGSLTHLHRTAYLASEVAHIAALLGSQLLSLRLGGRLAIPGRAVELGWGMEEVQARFPRLRYLQVDSPYRERPYLDTSVVDWLRPRRPAQSQGQAHSAPASEPYSETPVPPPRLTIAWTYAEGFWSDAEAWAATYDAFLDDAAVQCLKGWRGYVERVVYEQSVRPYPMVSVRPQGTESDGQEERLVRVQDTVVGSGDYWKRA